MNKFFKWVLSWFKKPEPKKPQTLAEMSATVIGFGRSNSTVINQVRVMKHRPARPTLALTQEQLTEVSRKAVDAVAKKKIVSSGFNRPVQSTSAPQPSRRNSDDDGIAMAYVATSSVYSSSSSDDGGSYSSGSCDSSSSSSCD